MCKYSKIPVLHYTVLLINIQRICKVVSYLSRMGEMSLNIIEMLSVLGMNISISDVSMATILLLTIIQISPIDFNPLSVILSIIGRELHKEVIDRVDKIEKLGESNSEGLIKLSYEISETRAINSRSRILEFDDDLLHNVAKSRESFDHIMLDITYYEHFCRRHPDFHNHIADIATSHIVETYKSRLSRNDFLK